MAITSSRQEGIDFVALRIEWFQLRSTMDDPENVRMLGPYVSRRDLNQLIGRCIDAEPPRFAIFHVLSESRFKRLDITDAREVVGYAPEDDLAEVNPALKGLHPKGVVNPSNQSADQESGIREEL